MIRGINQSLRRTAEGEQRVIGQITRIDCAKGNILYSVKTEGSSFILSSKDFQSLAITTFVPEGEGEIGCQSNLASANLVLSYRLIEAAKPPAQGELIAIEFVPKNFRFVDLATEPLHSTYVVEDTGPMQTEGEFAEQRRKAMLEGIREALRKPAAGERRELGTIERSECTNKGIFFYIKVATQILKLTNSSPQTMFMRTYTPDVENLQMGCGMKQVDVPVVFVFRETNDAKSKVAGDLVSLEFVPKTFTLN